MTTEDLVETLITEGVKAYKHNSKGSLRARKLDRHEPIEIDGFTFSYWREYATYRAGEWIKDQIPNAKIDVYLDGNDSSIKLELNDEEQQKLNRNIYCFLEEYK